MSCSDEEIDQLIQIGLNFIALKQLQNTPDKNNKKHILQRAKLYALVH